ncbi:MAG TPA: hypothetical protein VHH36_09665, partial [Candidatus Thermoplasmatota archaeon]|nr:hypothetical protein [Candidatus Thermoplasmatota archaeon]
MAENARPAARSAPLFAAFCLVTLLLAASPLAISPPVDVKVSGPALVAADQEARFRGSYTAAGIGLAGRPVE